MENNENIIHTLKNLCFTQNKHSNFLKNWEVSDLFYPKGSCKVAFFWIKYWKYFNFYSLNKGSLIKKNTFNLALTNILAKKIDNVLLKIYIFKYIYNIQLQILE